MQGWVMRSIQLKTGGWCKAIRVVNETQPSLLSQR